MYKVKTLILSAFLLFGFSASVHASDFTIPTNSKNVDISFIGKMRDFDLSKLYIWENYLGDPIPANTDIVYASGHLQANCASTAENYFANNFDAGFNDLGVLIPDGTAFNTDDNLNFTNSFGDLNILCKYQIYLGLDGNSGNTLRSYKYFDFHLEIPLPGTVVVSPAETLNFIMAPVIGQSVALAQTIFTNYWFLIVVFAIVTFFMYKFSNFIFGVADRDFKNQMDKNLQGALNQNRSIRKWHRKAIKGAKKYGFKYHNDWGDKK